MSHFTVMVIGENPEKQLAPYQENNMGDCPKEYLKFNDVEAEHRESYLTDETSVFVSPAGNLFSKYNDQFRTSGGLLEGSKYVCPNGWTEKDVPVNVLYPTFELYMSEHCGYEPTEDGNFGYWENPNAKWDWYQLGGRWTGHFKLKAGASGKSGSPGLFSSAAKPGYADQAHLKDIDLDGMREEARQKAIDKYLKIANAFGGEIPKLDYLWSDLRSDKAKNLDEKRAIYHGQDAMVRLNDLRKSGDEGIKQLLAFLDLDEYQSTADQFGQRASDNAVATFAVIKDGKWHEKGEMGWWGIVSDEKDPNEWNTEFSKLIDSLPGDTLLSVYDCHI